MRFGSAFNLLPTWTQPFYHLYITLSPTSNPQLNPPITIAWVHVTSSHSPHSTTLVPSQHISHQPSLSFLLNSLSDACLCITSSPPTSTPDYIETTVFEHEISSGNITNITTIYRPKGMKSHQEISQRSKAWNIIRASHKNITGVLMDNGSTFNLRVLQYRTSLPSLHHIITTNPKHPMEPSDHTIAWVRRTSSHSPPYKLTYYWA